MHFAAQLQPAGRSINRRETFEDTMRKSGLETARLGLCSMFQVLMRERSLSLFTSSLHRFG